MSNKYKILIIKGFPGHYKYKCLREWIETNNLDATIINFGVQIRRIDYYTSKLQNIIAKNYQNKKLILVGFSIGGIIAIRLAQMNNWSRIEKIITLAAPFKGSDVAKKYKILPALADISPNSKLLKEIQNAKIPNNKLICVSGTTDDLVDNSGTFLLGSKHIISKDKIHNIKFDKVFNGIKPILEKELLKYKQ